MPSTGRSKIIMEIQTHTGHTLDCKYRCPISTDNNKPAKGNNVLDKFTVHVQDTRMCVCIMLDRRTTNMVMCTPNLNLIILWNKVIYAICGKLGY